MVVVRIELMMYHYASELLCRERGVNALLLVCGIVDDKGYNDENQYRDPHSPAQLNCFNHLALQVEPQVLVKVVIIRKAMLSQHIPTFKTYINLINSFTSSSCIQINDETFDAYPLIMVYSSLFGILRTAIHLLMCCFIVSFAFETVVEEEYELKVIDCLTKLNLLLH